MERLNAARPLRALPGPGRAAFAFPEAPVSGRDRQCPAGRPVPPARQGPWGGAVLLRPLDVDGDKVRYPSLCRPAGRHQAGCPSGQRERSVKPSASPSQVRILDLPLKSPGQSRWCRAASPALARRASGSADRLWAMRGPDVRSWRCRDRAPVWRILPLTCINVPWSPGGVSGSSCCVAGVAPVGVGYSRTYDGQAYRGGGGSANRLLPPVAVRARCESRRQGRLRSAG